MEDYFKNKLGIVWVAGYAFMRLMNDVLRPFLDDFVIVYLDDILIFRKTWEEKH